jgi:hypothetical protein
MMRSLLVIAALIVAVDARAQVHDHSAASPPRAVAVDSLLASARSATEQYRDRKAAIAAGYRRVGRDIPSMGEHWLNTKLLVDGVFDVSRPQLLTYAIVKGRPVLTGVVYAIVLQQGQSPPDAFGAEAQWHEHNGSVDDEALLPEHHSMPSAVSGTRVAFLHAWVHMPPANGMFSAENWAIPFLRLELPVPSHFPEGAARALSLMTGGQEFFADLLGEKRSLHLQSLDECAAITDAVAAKARSENRGLDSDDLERLDEAWQGLLRDITLRSGVEFAKRINGGAAAEVLTSR